MQVSKFQCTNTTMQTHASQVPPRKFVMLTPLVESKVQFGILEKSIHFDLIKRNL